MMKHLFKSRKDYSNSKLIRTQQLTWADRTDPSKLQQIHQSIQLPPAGRLIDLTCSTKQSSYKIITISTYIISSSKVPISLLNLSRYSSLANICLSKASLHLGAWSYQSKCSIFRGYNWIFITKKYNNINGGISTIQVYWPSSGQLLSRTRYLSIQHSHKIASNK